VAVTENRGGANGGPQYNPANINGLGGNGQSGNIDYTGFGYAMNKAVNTQREAAPIETEPLPGQKPVSQAQVQKSFRDLFSDTINDAEPITNGVPVGPGDNESALPPIFRSNARRIENQDVARKYLPFLVMGTQIPGATDSYKQFVSYVEGMLWE
jgi:hypothetical protein